MSAQKGKKPVESPIKKPVEKVKEEAHKAAQAATAPAPVRRYRALLFLLGLMLITAAFGVLTFLVKTTPSFTIDLQITRGIQQINFPPFALLMSVASWPGFNPQS